MGRTMLAAREAIGQNADAQLAARCRAGDVDAFALLYARYEASVFRYAYHLLGHREDADDVKQETFVRAFQSIGRFRSEARLQTWLFKICGNLCRDRLKSWEGRRVQSQIPYEEAALQTPVANDPQTLVEQGEEAALMARALRALTPSQREIIVLRDLEEMNYDEIAAILGCSPLSAKVRAYRARTVLKTRVHTLLDAQNAPKPKERTSC